LFEEFVAGRGQALQRFGYALTGDWALAEDLLQTALARAYPRWSRVQRDNPEAYVRKIMLNTWSSWWRRAGGESCQPAGCPMLPGPTATPT
jgi:DNA-directed RNA polymerase specialized sigma24 family protein